MISDEELVEVERRVGEALDRGTQDALPILGYGVTAVVIGAPLDDPTVVAKRLPPFVDEASFRRHRDLVLEYVDQLRHAGVAVIDTEVRCVPTAGDRQGLVAYIVQPLLDRDTLGPQVLRRADPAEGHPLVRTIVDCVLAFTTERRGIDAQVTNWAWIDGSHRYIDVTTPFMVDEAGDIRMDLEVFLAGAPAVTRPVYRRDIPPAISRYCDPRVTLLDMCALLYKDDLDDWVPVFVDEANRAADPPITVEEARTYYGGEVRTWSMVNRMQRADRWWQRHVRRRRYDFFVPPMEYDPKAWRAKKRTF
ncbi:MAG TPA: DUF6206 family protein, partial [Acidimicrobiales bacterium]|nr:DUF6206 family protein [Acidimicrobiales bacterium]